MGTEMTGSVHLLSLEAAPCQALTGFLQPLLAARSLLTLVMLVGEAPEREMASDALDQVKAGVDDAEQLLMSCLRRSDRVIRCGETCCAAILFGAEVEGALRAIQRFQRALDSWSPLSVPLRVGFAAAPEEAEDSQALVALASQPRLRILPRAGAGHEVLPRMDELAERAPAGDVPLPKRRGGAEKPGRGPQLKQVLAVATASASAAEPGQRMLSEGGTMPPVEAIRQARALGVPYIAPPRRIPSSVRNVLSAEVMRQLRCLPIGRDRNALTVALADPTNKGILQRLEQITGLTIFPVMTDPAALEALAHPTRSRRASQVAASSARLSGD
ncbi:MAG TPA: hypothetical protein VH590_11895 [Ktedonobacterales bacterium]